MRSTTIFTLALCAVCAHAVNWYVDSVTGSDTMSHGSSPQDAFRTIERAAHAMWDGDMVIIANGVYAEEIELRRKGWYSFVASEPGGVRIVNIDTFVETDIASVHLQGLVFDSIHYAIYSTGGSVNITDCSLLKLHTGVYARSNELSMFTMNNATVEGSENWLSDSIVDVGGFNVVDLDLIRLQNVVTLKSLFTITADQLLMNGVQVAMCDLPEAAVINARGTVFASIDGLEISSCVLKDPIVSSPKRLEARNIYVFNVTIADPIIESRGEGSQVHVDFLVAVNSSLQAVFHHKEEWGHFRMSGIRLDNIHCSQSCFRGDGELIVHDSLFESVNISRSMIEVSNAMLTNVTFKTIKADECAGVNAYLAMLKSCQFDDITGTTVPDEDRSCTVTSS